MKHNAPHPRSKLGCRLRAVLRELALSWIRATNWGTSGPSPRLVLQGVRSPPGTAWPYLLIVPLPSQMGMEIKAVPFPPLHTCTAFNRQGSTWNNKPKRENICLPCFLYPKLSRVGRGFEGPGSAVELSFPNQAILWGYAPDVSCILRNQ